jgi:hypothetical protein
MGGKEGGSGAGGGRWEEDMVIKAWEEEWVWEWVVCLWFRYRFKYPCTTMRGA